MIDSEHLCPSDKFEICSRFSEKKKKMIKFQGLNFKFGHWITQG